jgi:hypothetical protein
MFTLNNQIILSFNTEEYRSAADGMFVRVININDAMKINKVPEYHKN